MKNGRYEMVVAPAEYPGKKYRGRYCYEHHLVWWRANGSLPGPGMIVHHKNGKHRDNRLENLELLTPAQHTGRHNAERAEKGMVAHSCRGCGTEFLIKPSGRRNKTKFCCRACYVSNWSKAPGGKRK